MPSLQGSKVVSRVGTRDGQGSLSLEADHHRTAVCYPMIMSELLDCAEVAEVVPGRFIFAAWKTKKGFSGSRLANSCIGFCIDDELVYEPFAADFGPLNVGCTYKFCHRTATLLQEAQKANRLLLFFCGQSAESKANAAVLIGAYQVFMLERTAEEAYQRLQHMEPFIHFKDACWHAPCFNLKVENIIKGLAKAKSEGFLDMRVFDINEYEKYEKIENGDMTWILPGKLLAFPSPVKQAKEFYGFKTKTPEDYFRFFRSKGITAVIRLNEELYEAARFVRGGFRHYELPFPDGHCPSQRILDRFLEIVEKEEGGVAVHCKAGLGRTGVLICCYLMKHHGFSATEALGYIRVCRPGSVIGHQQNFLEYAEPQMHATRKAWQKAGSQETKPEKSCGLPIKINASCQGTNVNPAMISAFSGLNLNSKPTAPSPASRLTGWLRLKSPSSKSLASSKGVARVTAPNGQPRKIPAAVLVAGKDTIQDFASEDQWQTDAANGWTITSSRDDRRSADQFSPLATALKRHSQ